MVNVFYVKFAIGRSAGGGYHANCAELSAHAAATTLADLELKLEALASALLDEASEGRVSVSQILVSRTVPPTGTAAIE